MESAQSAAGQHTTRPEDKVPVGQKIALGVGGFANATGTQIFQVMAQPIYNLGLGLRPGLVGLALTIPRIWDAITDPIMGTVSDNFRSKYGRRRPFIVLGAVLMAITFVSVWLIPRDLGGEEWGKWVKFGWLMTTGILYYTAYTIFAVPLAGLSYEMTADYHERTRVMAVWGFFFTLGTLFLNSYYPLTQTKVLFDDTLQGARVISLAVGVVIFIGLGILPGIFVKERVYHAAAKQAKIRLLPAIYESVQSRSMLMLLGIQLSLSFVGAMAAGLAVYLVTYHVYNGNQEAGAWLNGANGVGFQIVGFAAIPLIAWMAMRWGKRGALFIILGMAALGGVAKWFIYTPDLPYLLLLDPVLSGPIWVAMSILLPSMMADLCDVDEFQFGRRREGVFGAVFSWMQKMGFSLTFLVSGIALEASGFDEKLGANQPEGTLWWMRFFFAGSSLVAMLLGMAFLWFYSVSEKRAYEIRAVLEERRGKI